MWLFTMKGAEPYIKSDLCPQISGFLTQAIPAKVAKFF
jgi:hypothetical protein